VGGESGWRQWEEKLVKIYREEQAGKWKKGGIYAGTFVGFRDGRVFT